MTLHQATVTIDRETTWTGAEHVVLRAVMLPFLEGDDAARAIAATMDRLAQRLSDLTTLIVSEELTAADPRLQLAKDDPRLTIDASVLAQLERYRSDGGPGWLRALILELLELAHQARRRDPVAIAGELERGELTAAERLHVAAVILKHERDQSGDLRYAREQIDAAAGLLERWAR
jgi:hypothetical protein